MEEAIEEITYQSVVIDASTLDAARIANSVSQAGVTLLAFSASLNTDGTFQLSLIPEDPAALSAAAAELGIDLSEKKAIFLIRGAESCGGLGCVLSRLSEHGIEATSIQGLSHAPGTYAALVGVDPADVRKAADILNAAGTRSQIPDDAVDEASEESFPASDPPSFNPGVA